MGHKQWPWANSIKPNPKTKAQPYFIPIKPTFLITQSKTHFIKPNPKINKASHSHSHSHLIPKPKPKPNQSTLHINCKNTTKFPKSHFNPKFSQNYILTIKFLKITFWPQNFQNCILTPKFPIIEFWPLSHTSIFLSYTSNSSQAIQAILRYSLYAIQVYRYKF